MILCCLQEFDNEAELNVCDVYLHHDDTPVDTGISSFIQVYLVDTGISSLIKVCLVDTGISS